MYELIAKNSIQTLTYRAGNIGRVHRKMKELKEKDLAFSSYVIKRDGKIVLDEKISDKVYSRYGSKKNVLSREKMRKKK